jgi:hypothetical protein
MERSRIEQANDARITLTIALHGDHAWEMLLEDSNSYHSISHGWASDNLQDWEAVIAPALRRLFLNGRLRPQQRLPLMRPMVASPWFPCTIPRSAAPQHAPKTI